jgi:hypothetical protein
MATNATCDPSCASGCFDEPEPDCADDSDCETGEVCIDDRCVIDIGSGPVGPPPSCSLPSVTCSGTTTYCSSLAQFDPDNDPDSAGYDPDLGYVDYPENGETWTNQYRSYLQREAIAGIEYASAAVACLAADWTVGNGMPVGLIDMSEADGAIPGTSIGSPGHPAGTHENGRDIDLAYYQDGIADNQARPVCDHDDGGYEAYHCTSYPYLLDPWRTALFLAMLADHPDLRIIGVDGQVGPVVESAHATLCADGWITNHTCTSGLPMTYETVDGGAGWYYFHHHHFHVSFNL